MGNALYEYSDPRKGEHKEWGTRVFDYEQERSAVASLISSMPCTGPMSSTLTVLRVDAVASMLYLDYGRESGENGSRIRTAATRTWRPWTSSRQLNQCGARPQPGHDD